MLTAWLLVLSLAAFDHANELQHVMPNEHSGPHGPSRLNFSSASPLIFHSLFGLLQQWPNTFFPNGHTIAPCTVQKNTNLYHARWDDQLPPSPEWFGFDAEMSYWIAGLDTKSHLLTYRTTRDVKCLYFDGTSAALMGEGSMDSQMVLIHNSSANVPNPRNRFRPPPEPPPRDPSYPSYPGDDYPGPYLPGNRTRWNPIQDEYDRADGLCKFIEDANLGGPGWGYEGIVRMNTAFEMIWCNFSSPSAELVSHINVSAPVYQGLPKHYNRSPFFQYATYRWFDAAAKRYGFHGGQPGRGEARVTIDTCGMFSLYDPSLTDQDHTRVSVERHEFNLSQQGYWQAPIDAVQRTAGLQKLARRRRYQRATNISEADGQYMRATLVDNMRSIMSPDAARCSGIRWDNMAQEIVMANSADIYYLSQKLSSDLHKLDDHDLISWLADVRDALHDFFMPFYEYPDTDERLNEAFSLTAPQSRAAAQRCQAAYDPLELSDLRRSERLNLMAISDVQAAICRTLLPAFLTTERTWLANFNNISNLSSPLKDSRIRQDLNVSMTHHQSEIEELMAWLGWEDQWTSCSPACTQGQHCWIPIWPVMGIRRGRPWEDLDRPEKGYGRWVEYDEDLLWDPKCVDAERFPPE